MMARAINALTAKFRHAGRPGILALGLVFVAMTTAFAVTQEPLMITYGPKAEIHEGDPDHAQLIRFSVPEAYDGKLYFRVFDADTGGRYDELFSYYDTRTRFAVFATEGDPAAGLSRDQNGFLLEQATGQMLADTVIGEDPDYDDRWVTLFAIDASLAVPANGRRSFALLVQGERGNDGNIYDVFVSGEKSRNAAPDGSRLFSLMPTVRVPDTQRLTELRFRTPAKVEMLDIGSFDTSKGLVFLSNRFRSIPLDSGLQGEWVNTSIKLRPTERDAVSAITFGGGREIPNDITFYVDGPDRQPTPISLPPRSVLPNERPRIALDLIPQSCRAVRFDASNTKDPEGTDLTFRWLFHDGTEQSGTVATREYDQPGIYKARLEVFDGSGTVGNGSAQEFEVLAKAPPVAGFRSATLVAIGEAVRFDGSASSVPDLPAGLAIARYTWNFGDGTTRRALGRDGAVVVHRYTDPGTYQVALSVEDSSQHPCSTATATRTIVVNAAPQAEAGEDHRIALGTEVSFEAGAQNDADGDQVTYTWDMGDGTVLSGRAISHRYEGHGTYRVVLTADDGRGASNSVQRDEASVFVNAAPVASASMPAQLATGEVFAFDATGSSDPDGKISAVRWDFGDGKTVDRAHVGKAFFTAGSYDITVVVTDDSGLSNASASITRTIRVADPPNLPPNPVIGGSHNGVVDQPMQFDASASSDSDGSILEYEWDFGDGLSRKGVKVQHVYRKAGTYDLRLRARDNSGKINADAETRLAVTVAERPNKPAALQISAKSSADVNEVITFDAGGSSDPDGNILSHHWDFGDGTEGTGPKIAHSYDEPGAYTVVLTVTDDSNLANRVNQTEFEVSISHADNLAPVAEMDTSLVAETEQELVFDASRFADPDGRIVSYRWVFGDGHVSDQAIVRHAYARPGIYDGSLRMTDGSGLASGITETAFTVKVEPRPNVAPEAEAGPDQATLVAQPVVVDGGGSRDGDGSLVRYGWDFGNGKRATGQRATITYFEPGTYTVTLAVTDNSGQENASASDTLQVVVADRPNLQPVARMLSDRPAAIGEVVDFSGRSSEDPDGNIISYEWRFGDGSTASGIDVKHVYEQSGEYVASLTVTDDSGLANRKAVALRTVRVNEPPVAAAGADQRVTASVVEFSAAQSSDADGAIVRYEWDFGDGETGEGETISHTYREPGTYEVGLRITDDSGSISAKADDQLTVVVNALPVADAGPDIVAAPGEEVLFDGRRSLDPDGTVERFEWDFRDGATGEGSRVTHAFREPGTYFVQLKVTDDTGHDNATDFSQTEVVINATPAADAGRDILIAPGDSVTLSGAGSADRDGEITSWLWSFSDDHDKLRGAEVTRTFDKPGEYSAILTVIDDSSAVNNTDQDALKIFVNHQPQAIAGNDQFSESLRIVLDATASADADNDGLIYTWDLGDGTSKHGPVVEHVYQNGGVYPVVLTVDDGHGLANSKSLDALTVFINRPPVAVAGDDKNVCVGDIVVFDASKSSDPDNGLMRHNWDFGDGTGSDIFNPTKTFEAPGTYRVLLTVRDDSGLANDTHRSEMLVNVNPAPVANAGEDILACANTQIQFDGSNSTDIDGVVNRFSWDFGDGGSGGGDRPKHAYTQPGTYRVNLLIEGDNRGLCSPSASDEMVVTVINAPRAVIDAPDRVAVGDEIVFSGAKSYADASEVSGYNWDFGDGNVAGGVEAAHRFQKAGIYRVSLTVEADGLSEQCQSVTSHHLVTVNDAPIADAGEDRVVEVHRALRLSGEASSDSDGGLSSYEWDFGDGSKATGIEAVHTWRNPGIYTVTLTVRDNTELPNNTSTDAIKVEVKPAPGTTIETADVGCVGETIDFGLANMTAAADPDRIRWAFGDGQSAFGKKAGHSFAKPGMYTVSISGPVQRATEVVESFASRTIKINRPPVADAGKNQKACAAAALNFDASRSHDFDGKITAVEWDFGDGTSAAGAQVSHAFEKPGTYRVRLKVTDDSGSSCSSSTDELEVFVNAPPVADAGPDRLAWIGGARDRFMLDASGSSDPDGDALIYFWTLPDGEELDGEKAGHEFSRPGPARVLLEVADIHDLDCSVSSDEMTVIVRSRDQGD